MKKMSFLRTGFASLFIFLTLAAQAAPSFAETRPNAQQTAYSAKAGKIFRAYESLWHSISRDTFWWSWNRSIMERRKAAGRNVNDESRNHKVDATRRPGADKRVPITEDTRRIKARIFQNIVKAKPFLKQLRSITPVPASKKRDNDSYLKFSRDSEAALNSLRSALKKDDVQAATFARENLNGAG